MNKTFLFYEQDFDNTYENTPLLQDDDEDFDDSRQVDFSLTQYLFRF